jgi:hypothetical protein
MARRGLLALVVCAPLALAPAANAAYDPHFSLELSDTRPASAPAITSTLTQRSGESANRRIAVRFPPQFGFNPAFSVSGCTAAEERASACPESSRLGSERVESMLGSFSGPVYLSEDFRLLVYLRGLAGAVQQKYEGKLYLHPDGGVEIVFDNLPNVSATLAEIATGGGSRGLVLTPLDCGRYNVTGTFTSHSGDTVERVLPIAIRGCAEAPLITRPRARPRRFRRRTLLSWRLSEAGRRTTVSVQRLRGGEWRELRRLRGPARAGGNRLRVSGRRLHPGRYRFVLRAEGPGAFVSRARVVRVRRLG